MKNPLRSYFVLGLSLLALFASGVIIGRLTAPLPRHAIPAEVPASRDAWVESASRGLIKNLELDEAQQQQVRDHLKPVASEIFNDQERALFQMHLRLLELHDTLAKSGTLDDQQARRLAISRLKLKDLVIQKFPRQVRGNPALAIDG